MMGLVLSDIHGRVEAVKKIAGSIHNDFDFALVLGDLTNFGDISVERVAEAIPAKKFLAIPGNLDSWETAREIETMGASLHGRAIRLGKFTIVGFGGGLHGDPGRVLYSEKEIWQSLEKLLRKSQNVILATHLPPKNTPIDLGNNGMHLGSASVRKAIEEFRPRLQLCGHIHEAMGETRIGKTRCVNVGPAKEGNALALQLDEKISLKRISVGNGAEQV